MFVAKYFVLSVLTLTCLGKALCEDTELVDRIVGGRKAVANEYPFQASLLKRGKIGYFHTCGAALVAPRWLLTAAHCIGSNNTSDFKIMIGSNSLKNVTVENIYSVAKIVIKKGYDLHNFNNDIALIEVFPNVKTFDENDIKVAESPPHLNVTATVIGWGATSDGGSVSTDLQSADVDLISHDDCLDYYDYLSDSMMCAGFPDGEIDACQGDSGGPLIQIRSGVVYLIGIVSWGIGCAEPDHPGVYTNVAKFNAWIHHYIDATKILHSVNLYNRNLRLTCDKTLDFIWVRIAPTIHLCCTVLLVRVVMDL
ncbi:hypothetical protein JTE90_028764 [Oedothorax gibbosus]|uniref:Peptidase S1 domain-containing protein n=1 Tax=Oedothorax gibbosus TaxID=931172 RepID=A0AAV6VWU2_9ARAC|nr:hypothetical protein JTE90_028764 [Oedothorax gibbosus]